MATLIKKVLVIALDLFICASCGILKPKYITQVQHDTTTIYQNTNTIQYDSVYVYKDRNTYIKGDTVYTTITEYKDRWKIKEVHDTTYKDRAVFIDKEVPVEVEKKLTVIQELFITFGKMFIVILLVVLGYFGVKMFISKSIRI